MSNTALDDLIERKRHTHDDSGFAPVFMPSMLFDFQKALIEWSVRMGRRGIGAELKESYFRQAVKNVAVAESKAEDQGSLFKPHNEAADQEECA